MFERFTDRARAVVTRARDETREMHHRYVGTEHLLLALMDGGGIAGDVLHRAGLDRERVRRDIERLVRARSSILSDEDAAALRTIGIDLDTVLARIEESFGPDAPAPPAPPQRRGLLRRHRRYGGPFGPRARKVLELSLREALRLRHNHIGTEHILLGILREGDGLAAKILTDAGLTLDGLRRQVEAALDEAA